MNFENIYRTYMQLQKYRRSSAISEDKLREKLQVLEPGEMLSLGVMRGDDQNEGRNDR